LLIKEAMMELLKTLKLVKYERTGQIDAVELRRHKLIVKINEQIDLATNANTKVSERFVVKDNEGDEKEISVEKRVLRWWQIGMNGKIKLTIRYGSRPLQFAKGLDAIEVADTNEMVGVLEKFREATERGELDTLIAEQIAKRKNKKAVKVAE
jgi:hypothetical protein|tara:strand:+ start:757 stop:1215 length:459 start_codon:yes stop_codon:yes gene_type:complete